MLSEGGGKREGEESNTGAVLIGFLLGAQFYQGPLGGQVENILRSAPLMGKRRTTEPQLPLVQGTPGDLTVPLGREGRKLFAWRGTVFRCSKWVKHGQVCSRLYRPLPKSTEEASVALTGVRG